MRERVRVWGLGFRVQGSGVGVWNLPQKRVFQRLLLEPANTHTQAPYSALKAEKGASRCDNPSLPTRLLPHHVPRHVERERERERARESEQERERERERERAVTWLCQTPPRGSGFSRGSEFRRKDVANGDTERPLSEG